MTIPRIVRFDGENVFFFTVFLLYSKKNCDEFVKFFIFAMSDFNNLSFFLNYFEIDEKFQKTLIQKELLRYNYLKSQNENQYKRSKSSINRKRKKKKVRVKCAR